jgi:PKD repeat protein
MTMVETLLTIMLSALMVLPMLGWTTLALKEQADVQLRNLTGSSLGLVRTYFVRDVTNADRAVTAGADLDDCVTKGSTPLLVLAQGERRTSYVLSPAEGSSNMLVRQVCAAPGGKVVESTDLLADVIRGGTEARCDTSAALRDTTDAVKDLVGGLLDKAKDEAAKGNGKKGPDPVSTLVTEDDDECRRVTLQMTTTELRQVSVSAALRAGASSVAALAPPSVVITAEPTSGGRPLTVRFDASASSDPEGGELSHTWDFGDGSTAKGASPTHEYRAVGTFTARVTVTSTSGASSTGDVEIVVGDNVPVARIAAPPNGSSTFRGEPVAFSSAGSNDDLDAAFGGRIVGYAWDFGDGTTSTEANPQKSYGAISPAEGFLVQLAVFDDAGGTAVAESRVKVVNRTPTVGIVADPASGTAPLTVDLSAVVLDETTLVPNPPLSYAWDFGDGTTSTAADPAPRTYASSGTYTVRVTVTDDQGATANATRAVVVGSPLLDAPTGLEFVRSGKSGNERWMDLRWDARDGAWIYQVRLECESCGDTHEVSTWFTSVRVEDLRRQRTWYQVSVRALDYSGQWGPWSSTVRMRS